MDFTHFNEAGRGRMVDVSEKADTERLAVATGWIRMQEETLNLIRSGGIKKGDVLSIAQVAGIMGAKQTSTLIPMCHNIPITSCDVAFELGAGEVKIKATAKTTGKTGIEMEALTAVSICALTIYDMCKAVDKTMVIGDISLEYKSGGKSGEYRREQG